MIGLLLVCTITWPETGPVCPDETAQCRCSQEMHWDWEGGPAPLESYVRVRRCIPSTETCEYEQVIHYSTFVDDDGSVAHYRPDRWFFWKDRTYPGDRVWEYSVQNCVDASLLNCSPWGGFVKYRPLLDSDMRCYEGGKRVVPCR